MLIPMTDPWDEKVYLELATWMVPIYGKYVGKYLPDLCGQFHGNF